MPLGKQSLNLDRASYVPIYRQLADELRYRIATGTIHIGEKLPTIVQGAKLWEVNRHTVAQAYAELDYDGIAVMRRGLGTVVRAKPVEAVAALSPGATSGVTSFVEWISSHAQRTFGLDRQALAELLVVPPPRAHATGQLWFVECTSTQAGHHANEIRRKWDVEARGWSLDSPKEPPPGQFVATYFHYNDIRRRWPHRMADAVFVTIHPSRRLGRTIKRYCRKSEVTRICLYEWSRTMGRSIAADLTASLGDKSLPVWPHLVGGDAKDISLVPSVLHLFPPRVWWELSCEQRAQTNGMEVEYEIAEPDMARLAHQFGWAAREIKS